MTTQSGRLASMVAVQRRAEIAKKQLREEREQEMRTKQRCDAVKAVKAFLTAIDVDAPIEVDNDLAVQKVFTRFPFEGKKVTVEKPMCCSQFFLIITMMHGNQQTYMCDTQPQLVDKLVAELAK